MAAEIGPGRVEKWSPSLCSMRQWTTFIRFNQIMKKTSLVPSIMGLDQIFITENNVSSSSRGRWGFSQGTRVNLQYRDLFVGSKFTVQL